MLSLSSLIEFLLDMLRDPAAQNDFARDPNAALAARGLSGVTAQDVQDVAPMLADHTGVSASGGGAHAVHEAHPALVAHPYAHSYAHSAAPHLVAHDPLPAIQHITNAYEVDHTTVVRNVTQQYKQYATYKTYLTDHSIHAENGGIVIQDSFNQDNDGVDLKGAHVDSSVLAGHDANDSGNQVTSTTTQGSDNDDHATTVTGGHDHTAADGHAHAGSDDHVRVDGDDGATGATHHDPAESSHGGDVNDSYGAHAAASSAPVDDGADLAHHG